MGMVVNAQDEGAEETTGLGSEVRSSTYCGWFKLASTRGGANTHIAGYGDPSAGVASAIRLANLDVCPLICGVEQGPSAKTIAVGDEIFYAIVHESDGKVRVYVRKSGESSLVTSVTTNALASGFAADLWRIWSRPDDATQWADGSHAYPRLWNAVLSESELLTESNNATAQRTSNLLYAESNGTLVSSIGSFSQIGTPTFDSFDPFAGGGGADAVPQAWAQFRRRHG